MGDVNSYKPSSPEALVSQLQTAKTPTQVAEVVSKTPALSQIEKKSPGTITALIQGLNSKGGDGRTGSDSKGISQTIIALASDPTSNPADMNLMIQRLFQTLGTPSTTNRNLVSFA